MNFTQTVSQYRAGGLLRKTALVLWALAGWCALLVVASHGSMAHAQNANATIRGQVLDPSGALVPNARVVIVNKNTGVTVYTGQTDSAGAFVAPQVIPGTYRVTVTEVGTEATFATSSGFGRITGTQPNRQMQVSARFFF
jgi:hypothetical protein